MAITRWSPLSSQWLSSWPNWLEDGDKEWPQQKGLRVDENEKDLVVEAVVAGVPAEKINVSVEDGVLTIKAEAKEKEEKKGETRSAAYHYYYTVALSGGQWAKTQAEVEDGIVRVTIPKMEEVKPKRIEVRAKAKA